MSSLPKRLAIFQIRRRPMSALVGEQVKSVILGEWHVSPALDALEAEWEHAACCADAPCPDPASLSGPQPFDPDEWWPESCC